MEIRVKKLNLENFKGCKSRAVEFGNRTSIYGVNASGKSTIADAWSWLLFGKDAVGNEKFNLRPLDENGDLIHNVEIRVVAVLDVDGKELELSKVQREKWVKKRGTDMTELQGNENLFEINGYPKSERDYKEYISGLVNEELFKLISNPQAFSSLPWKKQRDILMRLVDDVQDAELARELSTENGRYHLLIPELKQASTDDIKAKYTKAMNTWKKEQIEIPARIDEASKQIVDIDTAELEIQKNYLKERIVETESAMDDLDEAYADYQKKSDEVLALRKEVTDYQRKASEKNAEQRRSLQKKIDECDTTIRTAEGQIVLIRMDIDSLERATTQREERKVELQNQWRKKKSEQYPEFERLPKLDESTLICPTCGQALPGDVKAQRIADYEERKKIHAAAYENGKITFEKNKTIALHEITVQGNAQVEAIKQNQSLIQQKNEIIVSHKSNIEQTEKEKADFEKILSSIPAEADLSADQVFAEMQLRLSKMEEALTRENNGAKSRSELKIKLAGLREELSVVEQKIALADNAAVEERIAELQAEQKIVGQKVADQERMIFLLEEFIREKMNRISESINAKFKTVSWKLFDMQINGGMKETCECTVGGVPYSSLNNGHRILAGLDILSTLGSLYDVQAPVFIDNAEALNDFNLPAMENQMILLKVSDDAELRVEVG